MKKYIVLLGMILLFIGCSKAPVTGRNQLLLVGKEEVLVQSDTEYDKVLKENKVLNNNDSRLIKKVGGKIATSVEEFLKENPEYKELINDFDWEFNLLESDQINAWCMPGGKVAFYTGILPYTKDEAGIAVVMGHEIAHAVADHGRERMSQQILQQYGAAGLSQILGASGNAASEALFMEAYGAASNLTVLKYGRDHEKEADKLGLIFMTMAGYDPNEAVKFWSRMAKDKQEPVEFFSTHPNSSSRIQLIQEYINSGELDKYRK